MRRLVKKNNQLVNIPSKLYHATFSSFVDSIMESGLGAKQPQKNWADSQNGVVYLANDRYIAEEYVETAEVDEDFYDENDIVVLEIDGTQLDKSKFFVDNNVQLEEDQEPSTFEYHGVIPSSALKVL